ASLGVLLALVNTIILLPALLAIFPIKAKKGGGETRARMDRILDWVTDLSTGRPKTITVVSLAIIALCLAGALRLHFSHDVMEWLPQDLPARQATEKIDQEFKGTVTVEVVLDTGRENGLYDPAFLKKLDFLGREMEGRKEGDIIVGKATSVADLLKEIHQALNENQPQFYVIPDNPALIPQEFLLFENSGSDDLEDVIDSQFRLARFTMSVPMKDAIAYLPLLASVEDRFSEVLGSETEITVTGMGFLFFRTTIAAIHSMAQSYIIAFLVITGMMILLIGSFKIGLVAMLPNLAPIIVTMGLIKLVGFPLDMFTMLIGSIAIGLAVDDTIHFTHNFRRYYAQTGDPKESVRLTLHTAGRAMMATTVVLSLGFFIFMFASMNNLFRFGLLTGVTVLLALLADFLLAPALMVLIHRNKKEKGQGGSK
ncbi:MAG: MMPL family transporter, partial [Deltaproteobacteria bacterium]|nr:MMPL family transporter [Deltaproteobacteria bacterium]